MKLSYNQATARDCSSLEQDLVFCEREGFDYIEIRLDMLEAYLERHRVEELAGFFRNHRLKPHAFNALYLYEKLYSDQDDPAAREELEQRFLKLCRIGQAIGSHYVIVVPPFTEPVYEKPFAEAKQDCVRILRRLSELAAPYNMKLCFELVGLPKSCVRSIRQAKAVVEETDRENVGYVFDAYNIFCNGKTNSFEEMKLVQREKIFAVHINNADDSAPEEVSQDKRRFCDQGVIRLDRFLGTLKEIGYDGMVSIETFRPEYWAMEPETVIRSACRTTRSVLEQNGCL